MVDQDQFEQKSEPEPTPSHVSSSGASNELPVTASTGPNAVSKATSQPEGNQNNTSDILATNPNKVYLPGTISKNTNAAKSTLPLPADGALENETHTMTLSSSPETHMHTKGRSHSVIDKPESVGDDQKDAKDGEGQAKSKKAHKYVITIKLK